MRMRQKSVLFFVLSTVIGLVGCEGKAPAPASAPAAQSPFKLTATIQDIMALEVGPAANYLWESVSSVVTAAGTEDKQPRTDKEWLEARRNAITLIEATNLLVMEGRRVAAPDSKLKDEGGEGILTAQQAQAAIEANRAGFIQYAHALHEVGERVLAAIDAKDAKAMMDAGEEMDPVCEACHMTFWYPNQ